MTTFGDPSALDIPTEFELEQWEKDARRLVTCGWCGGGGQWFARQYRHQEGEWQQCPKCDGEGRRVADLDKLRLINRIRGLMEQQSPVAWGSIVGMGEEPAP